MTKRGLILILVPVLAACSSNGGTAVSPTETSPIYSPGDQGLDRAVDGDIIDEVLQELASGKYGYVDRFLLIQNERVLIDESYAHDYETINAGRDPTDHPYNYYHTAWHPYYQGSDLHTLQSVTKSVAAIVIGIAIGRGELPGASVTVLDYVKGYEIDHLDERKRRITLEDLLTMRSGLAWDEWSHPVGDPRNSVTQLEESEDWIQFVLDLPMAHEPGEVFVYNSGAVQLLPVVVKEATGLALDAYAEEHLFQPLGISEYYWKKTPGGWPDTEGGLYLRAEDLAKIGSLVLHGGVWEGEQIVPAAWVAEMTSPKVADVAPQDRGWNYGYGYLWWLPGDGAQGDPQVYAALGYGGQFLFVVPERDLVAVFTGWNIYGTRSSLVRDLFLEEILPAAGGGP